MPDGIAHSLQRLIQAEASEGVVYEPVRRAGDPRADLLEPSVQVPGSGEICATCADDIGEHIPKRAPVAAFELAAQPGRRRPAQKALARLARSALQTGGCCR
jgi:hypothetical protein